MATELKLGTGWVPEEHDPRDLTHEHEDVAGVLEEIGVAALLRGESPLPPAVDLRAWCYPVQFQGGFNTCNAHVVAGLLEFFEKRAFGRAVGASRLFLYKVAKNFLQAEGNVGVFIRQTMGVLRLVGVPPEKYWPYLDPGTYDSPNSSDPRLDAEPSAFCYAIARDYTALSYYRLDVQDPGAPPQSPEELLRVAKAHLAAGVPFGFGFPLFESLEQARITGEIPYPAPGEKRLGNHAVIAVGYDDGLTIQNAAGAAGASDDSASSTAGALLVQNSWSAEWGDQGFGWIPYEYVLRGRCRDFWTLLKAEWTDAGDFQLDL